MAAPDKEPARHIDLPETLSPGFVICDAHGKMWRRHDCDGGSWIIPERADAEAAAAQLSRNLNRTFWIAEIVTTFDREDDEYA